MQRRFCPPLRLGGFVPPTKKNAASPASAPLQSSNSEPATPKGETKGPPTSNEKGSSTVPTAMPAKSFVPPMQKNINSLKRKPGEESEGHLPKKRKITYGGKQDEEADGGNEAEGNTYWTALWCKFSKKKHKTYTDGIVVCRVKAGSCELLDMSNKSLGKTNSYSTKTLEGLVNEAELFVGGKEIILQTPIKAEEFLTGRVFLGSTSSTASKGPSLVRQPLPELKKSNFMQHRSVQKGQQLHDPEAADAFILQRDAFTVVLDPRLTRYLRPHQKEGIKFMYSCLMGLNERAHGCILADEMGLGKTLQTLCILWTLLKQGPNGLPTIKKALIVTPSSLVKNWGKEIKKWLGAERVRAMLIGEDNRTISREKLGDFKKGAVYSVLVMSYEQCRQHIDLVSTVPFGLLICDEAHRLRNLNNKTTQALGSILTNRRVLLSGTPFQNNLAEFYALAEFSNGGCLGAPEVFRNAFAKPIEKSRDPHCKKAVKEAGEARAKELFAITQKFILRRTAEVLEKYLPPRTDHILFCTPSDLQRDLYRAFLSSDDVSSIFRTGNMSSALTAIITLKKICNHPQLLLHSATPAPLSTSKKKNAKADSEDEEDEDCEDATDIKALVSLLPATMTLSDVPEIGLSGKLRVMASLLASIRTSGDSAVIVSFYKQTLDLLQRFCESLKYTFLRLDGDTLPRTRQELVDRFNDPDRRTFVFLLSTKAGGEGLNLIGASRLILFDCDWNPAYERQAMARVWRDGQKKDVHIYRLLTTGTIDEKIFQRQVVKQAMSQKIMHAEMVESDFREEDLKDIFCFTENTASDTLDLLAGSKKGKNKGDDKVKGALKDWRILYSPSEETDSACKSLPDALVSCLMQKSTESAAIDRIDVEKDNIVEEREERREENVEELGGEAAGEDDDGDVMEWTE